ncbi:hypothetical protein [Streptomyces griseorubiginosus]|uniref:hypothetical protein n=1 Tax=Streptomyces griseorubiginosus TaxID=67304 RepID=UPI001AD74B4C|nr:hypothetical protein [Streptomyces griseorubiginosus]MBO4257497.1 hypothetical protein [Streptomyces griseorubiginosus]
MTMHAELKVFLRVNNDRALDKVLSKIRQLCPLPLGEAAGERYWKDPGLQDVRLPVSIPPGSVADMTFEALRVAWALGGPWSVTSIGEPGTEGWEFEALAEHKGARFHVPGLEWARISLRDGT